MTVERVRLGEVLKLADADVSVDPGSRYPMLGILGHGRGLLLRETIQGSNTSYKTLRRMALGQVVYSRFKAFEGAFAVVSQDGDGRYASSEFPNFDVDHSRVSVEWLGHVLHTGWFGARVGELSQGIGARRERLGVDRFLSIEIPLPVLEIQREIAARVDHLARTLSDSRLQAITTPEAVSAVAPEVVADVLHSLALPAVPVGDLYEVVNDVVHPGQDVREARRFVGLEHIKPHVGSRIGETGTEDLKGRKLRFAEGDVLYGYLRPYLNKVWVADGPGLCSVEQYVLRPRLGVNARLLGHVLRMHTTLDAANAATHSLQLPRIRGGLLAEIQVPDIRLAAEGLADRLDSINNRARRAAQLAGQARVLIGSLLPAARNEEFRKLLAD